MKIAISSGHLREDIREARSMIRELEKGIVRDEKELNSPTQYKPKGAKMKLGTAAKACRGKRKRAFIACVKAKMRGGKHRRRRSRR